ncbi:adenylate/guanylate cyclase domain-containing protein [Variovorax saccharolyticus]|uniref:adenylate/guanylate cyclase domain-containing protein n=1 Tax=Variovorax saccharolyticus TaxID=3053516 RepID=UPI0025762B37|nr:adenylate/guanylate cyclase domain-containing protein [Variovorax sp. J22R187]MDM0019051.1 adenylate/guanylate cyclase domain-containing protein [Variovorax sp. J22R187]
MRLILQATAAGAVERLDFNTAEPVTIGRSPDCQIQVEGDHVSVSRLHARLVPTGQGWVVEDHSKVGTLVNGMKLGPGQRCALRLHDELRVGPLRLKVLELGGQIEQTMATALKLTAVNFATLDPQLMLQSALALPRLFGEAHAEGEVLQKACAFLVQVLSPAVSSAYVVEAHPQDMASSRMLATCSRDGERAPVLSRRVIGDALQLDGSVAFFNHASSHAIDATVHDTTRTVGACLIERSAAGAPIVLYVVGERSLPIENTDIAAGYLSLVSTLTRQHLVAQRQAHMAQYFSPKVVDLLMRPGGRSSAEGDPRVMEATTLIFDLRGFCLSTEAAATDLLRWQKELRSMMDVVSREVFAHEGTVIDYQGDGCFAAWGVPFEQADQAQLAVDCALRIIEQLKTTSLQSLDSPSGPVCGIAIAKGQVLAGSMTSSRHFKYGLLGTSVNCASRVEALTKPGRLDAPLLVTEEVAKLLDATRTPFVRAARVALTGMETLFDVYEVIDPARGLSSPGHAAQWEILLRRLEGLRHAADLPALQAAIGALGCADDARVRWLQAQCRQLEEPAQLSRWDGVVRYEK